MAKRAQIEANSNNAKESTAGPSIQTPTPARAQFGYPRCSNLWKTTKQTQFLRTSVKSTASNDETRRADLAVAIRGLYSAPSLIDNATPSGTASPHCARNQDSRRVKASDSLVARALSVPRRDSSRRLVAVQPLTTKQTQSRRTLVESTPSKGEECRGGGNRERYLQPATGVSPRPAALRTGSENRMMVLMVEKRGCRSSYPGLTLLGPYRSYFEFLRQLFNSRNWSLLGC